MPKPGRLRDVLISSEVVVIAMTTLSLIAAVVTIAIACEPLPGAASVVADYRWFGVGMLCLLIAAYGSLAIRHRVAQVRRRETARDRLNDLYIEGRKFPWFGRKPDPDEAAQLADWHRRVESVLVEYLDHTYVSRFHVDANEPQWMAVGKRVEKIEEFLRDLSRS